MAKVIATMLSLEKRCSSWAEPCCSVERVNLTIVLRQTARRWKLARELTKEINLSLIIGDGTLHPRDMERYGI